MKRIETESEREKRKHRNNLIVGIVLIVLIGFSSLGYAIMSKTESQVTKPVKYGNLEFTMSNDMWVSVINSKAYYFSNLPEEVENVSVSGEIKLDDFYGKPVYYVNLNSAANTLNYLLNEVSERMQEACLVNESCSNEELPVKTCEDNVIIFYPDKSETKIYKIDNCIFLEGNSFQAIDKLIYRMLNIA